MALTKGTVSNSALQNKRFQILAVDFDSSYPTGGEALTPGDFGMEVIEMMIISPQDGYVFEYDYSGQKIKAIVPVNIAAGSETAGANNTVVTKTGALEVAGSGSAIQQVGAEVSDSFDLSGITDVKCAAIGY